MNVTYAEKEFFYAQFGDANNFSAMLFRLIQKADTGNTEKIRMGFPDEVKVVERYQSEPGYWEDLQSRMNR